MDPKSSGAGMPNGMPSHHGSGNGKPMRILACVLCQHRKIKCDRTFPCANCVKANVTCTPSTPAPARKRRRPNQDLQERLARCEELLKVYASGKPDDDASTTDETNEATALFPGDMTSLKWKPPGKLIVEDDGGVRFVDSFMLSTIHEELRAMREIVEYEDIEDLTPDVVASTPDDNADLVLDGGIFGRSSDTPTQAATLEDLQPSPAQIFRLWQIYLEQVNPLTKIIHVPTLQPLVVEAANGSQNVPQGVRTLLFSIYTMAAVSLSEDECKDLLGYSRGEALQRFSNGVRQSLIQANFLKTYDLETLQALVIYLISLQRRYNPHAAWILNGVVLRIAQKMGLHRDGEILGLSPFETEMRRRVWWQIIMVDAKYALMSGLGSSMLPQIWDTKEPKNVNDADLFPGATEPVQARDGPTEMIMVILTNRLARFLVETPGVEPIILLTDHESVRGPAGPSPQQVEKYRQLLSTLAQNLHEITDKYCDTNLGPLHEMVFDMKEQILQKLGTMLLPATEREFSDEVKTPADNVFQIAVESLAHDCQHDTTIRGNRFAWYSRFYFQDNMFLFVVAQLCVRTTGRLVEKAWLAVEETYENNPDIYDISRRPFYQMALFVLRAWRIRSELLRARGIIPEPPLFVAKLRARMPLQDETKSEPSTISASASATASASASAATSAATSATPSTMTPLQNGPPQTTDSKMPLPTADPVMEQFLSQPYMDPASMDWDMWSGDMLPAEAVLSTFDGFIGSQQNLW